MGPNIEPCSTPDKSIWKTVSVSFIFTPFLRFNKDLPSNILGFKYECTKFTASSGNLYA